MKRQSVQITNRKGLKLAARFQLPVGKQPRYYALVAHCFTCSKNNSAIKNISDELAQEGVAVLAVDFTGLGNSEGEFSDTDFSTNVTDLVDAAKWLEENHSAPKLMIGHSLGGAAVIFAAEELTDISAVATIGAPAQPEHVTRLLKDDIETIEEKGKAGVNIGGRDFKITKEFLEDLRNKDLEEKAGNFKGSLLIAHSPQDQVVNIENAARLYKAARHPKSFISLDGADHLLSDSADSRYLGKVIATWATRYIEIDNEDPGVEDQQTVRASLYDEDGFTTMIETAQHHWMADEPKKDGGKDLGPNPYQLLLSALGACTAMTLRMYAERKGWDLEEVAVLLNHNREHKKDCVDCEKPEGKIDYIRRKLELKGSLKDNEREKLLEIAERCPVHKTLSRGMTIKTTLNQ